MAETLSMASKLSFAAGILFLGVSVVLWRYFNIPSVFEDFYGRNTRKSVKTQKKNQGKTEIRELTEDSRTDMLEPPPQSQKRGDRKVPLEMIEEIILIHTGENCDF